MIVQNLIALDGVESYFTPEPWPGHIANPATMNQVHGIHVAHVKSPESPPFGETDAMFTTLPNLWLAVKAADCMPVLIAHPSGMVGVIHAGRKGMKQGIIYRFFEIATATLGISDGFHVWIGPHLCTRCHQIHPEWDIRYNLFDNALVQLADTQAVHTTDMTVSPWCTCHHGLFHSFRKDKTPLRNYGLIRQTINPTTIMF